jgi:hypothetical protein
MLADSCIASAQKEQRRAIFASEGAQGDVAAELSQIMKSADSPDSLSEPGLNDSGLQDVSFSALADLSMVRESKDTTPFHKLAEELSPIAAKSPEISMTPFLNVFNLDASSGSGGDSRGAVLRSATRHHHSSSSAAQNESAVDVSASLNRSLFGTSTKRKRTSVTAGEEDEDATLVYAHQQSLRYCTMRCLHSLMCLLCELAVQRLQVE